MCISRTDNECTDSADSHRMDIGTKSAYRNRTSHKRGFAPHLYSLHRQKHPKHHRAEANGGTPYGNEKRGTWLNQIVWFGKNFGFLANSAQKVTVLIFNRISWSWLAFESWSKPQPNQIIKPMVFEIFWCVGWRWMENEISLILNQTSGNCLLCFRTWPKNGICFLSPRKQPISRYFSGLGHAA